MIPAAAIYFGLVLARVGAFVAAFPLFAPRTPKLVRIGLALALALFFVASARPAWHPVAPDNLTDLSYLLALLRETIIGLAAGFAFGLFLLPARVAGEFVSHQMGLAVSPQHAVTDNATTTTIPQLFETAAGLMFLGLDGHHVVLSVLAESFNRMPLGGAFAAPPAAAMVAGLSTAHEMGLLLAGPLALCLFLLAVALALTARAAPQLNIHSIGFTLQAVVVLVGLLFLMPELTQTMAVAIQRIGADVGNVWR